MTIIKHKRGSGVPASSELEVGELAIDTLAAKLYTKIGNVVVELGGGSSDGGSGAGMVISETEPVDPETGLQWLEAGTGRVWIWDEDKWLEFPAAVPETVPVIVSEDEPEGSIGQLWYKPSENAMYVYDGSDWQLFGSGGDGGNGGDGGDGGPLGEALLLVGGGGGGGGEFASGGGGAGGLVFVEGYEFKDGAIYTLEIGAGGISGTSGSSTDISDNQTAQGFSALGGGFGGGYTGNAGAADGGCGGGGSYYGRPSKGGGVAIKTTAFHMGNDGGDGTPTGLAGGGGGAGEPGEDAIASTSSGNGGNGFESDITGVSIYYAGGGGAGVQWGYGDLGTGGLGGGGDADQAGGGPGVDGLGGGGAGGTDYTAGGNGGDGVAIIRTKKTPSVLEGSPEVSNDGDYNIYVCKTNTRLQF